VTNRSSLRVRHNPSVKLAKPATKWWPKPSRGSPEPRISAAEQRVADRGDQLVDRYPRIAVHVGSRAGVERGVAEGDVHGADQLVDRDHAVAVAVAVAGAPRSCRLEGGESEVRSAGCEGIAADDESIADEGGGLCAIDAIGPDLQCGLAVAVEAPIEIA